MQFCLFILHNAEQYENVKDNMKEKFSYLLLFLISLVLLCICHIDAIALYASKVTLLSQCHVNLLSFLREKKYLFYFIYLFFDYVSVPFFSHELFVTTEHEHEREAICIHLYRVIILFCVWDYY